MFLKNGVRCVGMRLLFAVHKYNFYILEYGQTEATASICLGLPEQYNSSSVGTPIFCNYVKLVDIPEKNILSKSGVGEICIKGDNVFKGYFKDEESTRKVIDEDGWLHTGDVGMWLPVKRIFLVFFCRGFAPESLFKLIFFHVDNSDHI